MLFLQAKIKNFRSVKEVSLNFDQKCRVLVGMNESGKSNILRALSFLSDEITPIDDDLRQPLPDEEIPDEAYVWFEFRLVKNEVDGVFDALSKRVLCRDISKPVIKHGKGDLSLRGFCEARSKVLWCVDIISKKKAQSWWGITDKSYKVISGWKKVSPEVPANYGLEVDGTEVLLKDYFLVNTSDFPSIPEAYLTDLDADALNDFVGDAASDLVSPSLPGCQLWSYTDSNLLPPQVSLSQFSTKPDFCIPLRHMFELAGVQDIPVALSDAQKNGVQALRNLLDRVGQSTTRHIKQAWSELEGIDILIEPNGDNLDISVKDSRNRYAFQRRSDGFKRFVTFLLMISARVRTGGLENNLLLMDEPDIGLHPSGAQYLRDELLAISSTNYVVYSTHSIFMIDRNDVTRHLLVRKKNEISTATSADSSNIVDEEVLYQALGYSVFQSLRAENLVFEGWKDKRLFKVAIDNLPAGYKNLGKTFKDVGLCHLQGVKDAARVSAILEVGARNYLIVSDNDQVAIQAQAKFKGEGHWKRYSEIFPETQAVTGEDFVKVDSLCRALNEVGKLYPGLPLIATNDIAVDHGRLDSIKAWLEATKIIFDKQAKDNFVMKVKNEVFDNLTADDIEQQYFDFLKSLSGLFPLGV